MSLRKKCPYSELFWFVFSGIRTEYGVSRISPYSVRMQENTDQNDYEYGPFLPSVQSQKSHSCINILYSQSRYFYLCYITESLMLFFVIYSSLLTAVVIYDTLLLFKLNMNTFYTHIFVFSHFYLIFLLYFYLLSISKLPMIAAFW